MNRGREPQMKEIPMKNPEVMKSVPWTRTVTKLCSCLLVLAAMRPVAEAATITVTDTGDMIAVDGLVTLREAITSANNNANVNSDVVAMGAYGTDTIKFNIAGAGVHTIAPTIALPTITDPVTIDGYTQPGSAANTQTIDGDDAVLLIELNGANAGAANGFTITAGSSTVRGLVINGFTGLTTGAGNGDCVERRRRQRDRRQLSRARTPLAPLAAAMRTMQLTSSLAQTIT